ncbi:bifunctional diguanylate cyclase/phosphodiesterase [Methylocapsa sp. S129]|uniref:putative bifunctional diguanylate cyclase/phosphodiesterase n=1 Tax=Methylocapsa sp. S129 TaxID=1641869 RepID=UPI00131C6043|nr:EAL domain-containing protein [Methylocapsa sp. S129]
MSDLSGGANKGQDGPIQELGDGSRLLEDIVRVLPLGVAIQSADGTPLYANAAAIGHGAHRLRESEPPHAALETERAGDDNQGRILRSQTRIDGRTIEINRHAIVVRGARYNVATSADVTDQANLEDELFRRAYFDDLTGLPNRALLEKGVKDLIEGGSEETKFALAFIDIDNFKSINDYYGLAAGDDLLVKIAGRIAGQIRSSDMLARVGGDEFVLLLSPIGGVDELDGDVEHLSARLKEPFFIDGHELFTSASIGVSVFPIDGSDPQVLCANADAAMHRVKSAAKGAVGFFGPGLGDSAAERAKLEQRLRLAIRDRRLSCAFQPKVDFRSRSVVGIEVLLRWRDEEGVIHAPGDFVNLAVELGLMDDITRLVLAQTVEAIDTIDEAFGPHATISINIAAKQAGDFRFMRSFADALAATRYPERFMVELTEEAFLLKSQFQTRVLPMLRDIGTKISIDDFGVGYSSLSALADITADEIKVDRSFITQIHRRPRSQSLLTAIESLGAALGMSVVVEGVETIEELIYLEAATRIRLAQGYYFARPMSFDEMPRGKHPFSDVRQAAGAREAVAGRAFAPRAPRRNDGRAL